MWRINLPRLGWRHWPAKSCGLQEIGECPVQMEAKVNRVHRMKGERLRQLGGGVAAEVEIIRVHVAEEFVLGDNYIDPEKWSPLIYNFRHYFRLAKNELGKTFRAER
jgi:flavin reductase (DIM6/NTAB) family NADH-FMN oxidoreductase RutF